MTKSTIPGTGDYVKSMISSTTKVPEDELWRTFTDQMAKTSAREACKSNWRRSTEAALYAKSHPPNEE
jgi:hypothetical protein